MSLPVLVINRDIDRERWGRTRAAARARGVEPIRIKALDAHAPDFPFHRHADLIGPTFWGRDTIKPGAIGCFLSHRAAWTRVVAEGWPSALILEDDADLTEPPDRVVDGLARGSCDVLFANDRMADRVVASRFAGEAARIDALFEALARAGGPEADGIRHAPGGDAYAVTARGAAGLLEATAQTGIICGVDWAMIWAALPRDQSVEGIGELEILDRISRRPGLPLRARALANPVARLRKGPSVLKHSVEVPIRDLLAGRPPPWPSPAGGGDAGP